MPDTQAARPVGVRRSIGHRAMFWSNFVWTLLGAIASIATTIAVEALRRPRIEIRIPEIHSIQKWRRDKAGSSRAGVPFREATFVYLEVRHKPLPTWAAWLQREPAISCYGDVMFYGCRDLDPVWAKSPEGPGPMPVRWTRAPEPKARADSSSISAGPPEPSLFDPNDFTARPRMDISPGDAERIDTVAYIARDDGLQEEYFHCWNNENYLYHDWRNHRRRLPHGEYYVVVTIVSSGARWNNVFKLNLQDHENMGWRTIDRSAMRRVFAKQKAMGQVVARGFD
jgi:hypothetical protein